MSIILTEPSALNRVETKPVSSERGPAVITILNNLEATMVSAPGVGRAVNVTFITVGRASAGGGALVQFVFREGLAGTIVQSVTNPETRPTLTYNPPWQLPENTALTVQRVVGNQDAIINYHFYVSEV